MNAHALLSPSAASRWLVCTPSARLEAAEPASTTEYADEGTLAHKLGELLIRRELGMIKKKEFDHKLLEIEDHELYDDAMYDYCMEYAMFVIEKFNEAKAHTLDARIFLEVKLKLNKYIPEGFGTGDVVIAADKSMTQIDLKYGMGVQVSAVENSQLKVYALGALEDLDFLYDIENIEMIIFQPRLDMISSWETSVIDLKEWAAEVLVPRAKMAYAGEGEFFVGDHCRFCKIKAKCRAHAEYNLQLAKLAFLDPPLLTDDEIGEILAKTNIFQKWINAVSDYALNEAVASGKVWPDFKLVEGRSNRKYTDPEAIEKLLLEKGYTSEEILKKKLKGITEMTKELGKKDFDTYLSQYLFKPPGKLALVPSTDERPAYNKNDEAIKVFSK